tara:strand:+ start:232 stop:540 length:309 start_codon:yes stop_codon:yes gene_type:complete
MSEICHGKSEKSVTTGKGRGNGGGVVPERQDCSGKQVQYHKATMFVCHVRAILCFLNAVRLLSGPNGVLIMRFSGLWCYVYTKRNIATKCYAVKVVMQFSDA